MVSATILSFSTRVALPFRSAKRRPAPLPIAPTGIGCDQVIVLEKLARRRCSHAHLEQRRSGSRKLRQRLALHRRSRVQGNRARALRPSTPEEVSSSASRRARVWSPWTWACRGCAGTKFRCAEEFIDTRRIELQVGPIDKPILHTPSAVNIGNPHCIFWVDDVQAVRPRQDRSAARASSAVSRGREHLARRGDRDAMHRTQGLGARRRPDARLRHGGLCRRGGRGTSRSLPAAWYRFACRAAILTIEWADTGHVLMTGPFAHDFDGEVPARLLSARV